MTFTLTSAPDKLRRKHQFGGEEEADLANPKTHRSEGLSFAYPGNWEIDAHQNTGPYIPFSRIPLGDAIVILQIYPIEIANDLKTFAREFSENAAFSSALGSVQDSVLTELPSQGGYAWMREEFDIEVALLLRPFPISVFTRARIPKNEGFS